MNRDPIVDLLRRRTWAGWIDVLFLCIVYALLSAITGHAHVGTWTTSEVGGAVLHHGVAIDLPTGPFVAWIALALLYYSLDEVLTGQTIGKRLMGLQVIMVNGHPLDARRVLLRTVGRIVDVLPVFYLVGWIAMRGPHRPPQRLGDRLAGTTVVPVSYP
jgi:uncharacterized RDD family membrane protein YckC